MSLYVEFTAYARQTTVVVESPEDIDLYVSEKQIRVRFGEALLGMPLPVATKLLEELRQELE